MRAVLVLTLLALTFAPLVAAEETFDSGSSSEEDYMQPGDTFSFTFNEVDEEGHHYHCHPHPWMTAMVHVFPEGTMSSHEPGTNTFEVDIVEANDSEDWGYSIEHLSIEVGDTVVWTNAGKFPHTVTKEDAEHDEHTHGDDLDDHHEDDHLDDHHDTVDTPGFGLPVALMTIGLLAFLRRQ